MAELPPNPGPRGADLPRGGGGSVCRNSLEAQSCPWEDGGGGHLRRALARPCPLHDQPAGPELSLGGRGWGAPGARPCPALPTA